MVTIGITTFRERFESHLKPLVRQLNGHPAIIAVNANNRDGLDDQYRKDMMRFLAEHDNVSVIFYQQMRGLTKMWNDLVIHSPTEWVLLLNDDVLIPDVDALMQEVERSTTISHGMHTINGSFSHFCVSKQMMIKLGWFDERFLGFGEEDADIVWRHIGKLKHPIPYMGSRNIINASSNIRDESVQKGVEKYTLFNRAFAGFCDPLDDVPVKYVASDSGFRGMFGYPVQNAIDNLEQYPYEPFFMQHRDKI